MTIVNRLAARHAGFARASLRGGMTQGAPTSAEGDLGRTPFAHLLVYALDRSLTGALHLVDPAGVAHIVHLERGGAVRVRSSDGYALLGDMLVESGAVSRQLVEKALEAKGPVGDMLVLTGCLDRETLEQVADAQLLRRMLRLFDLPPETTYRYVEGERALDDQGGEPTSLDPLFVIWAGVRQHGDRSSMMEGTLAMWGDKPLRLHADAPIGRFAFEDQEQLLVDHLSATPSSIEELEAFDLVPPEVVRRLCYLLLIARQLELGGRTYPVGATPRSRTQQEDPSSGRAVGKLRLKRAVHRMGAAAPDPSGDGERSSSPRAVDLTRFDAAADSRPVSSAVISSGERDAAYPVPDSAPPPIDLCSEETPRVASLSPEDLFRLARAKLDERDVLGASEAASLACRLAPDHLDYRALWVWVRSLRIGADVKALSIELDELLQLRADHVEGRFYRGVIRRKLGDDAGAMNDLRRVLEGDPGHRRAATELAALEARHSMKREGSVFNRLLKR
jgi:hypothetical protein